jgi:hypothetical protein
MALLRASLIFVVCLSAAIRAGCEGPVEVTARADRRAIAIGDTFRVDVDLEWQDGINVKPLALGENIGEFAVRDVAYGPISATDSVSTRRVSLLLTVFETGAVTIPPLEVLYVDEGGNPGKAATQPIGIEVESVLSEDADDIKDIKAPLEVPKRWRDIITSWILLVGLGMVAAASVLVSVKRRGELEEAARRIWLRLTGPLVRLVRWLLRRLSLVGRDEYGAPALDDGIAEPYLTPEEAAMRELDRIDGMRLSGQGKTMELNVLVSETVRRYLERRFRILAMESPTSHTLEAVRKRDVSSDGLRMIREILEETDLVKFSGLKPREGASGTLTRRGRHLVRETGRETVRGTPEGDVAS